MRTSNPALTENTFTGLQYIGDRSERMSVQGTAVKTMVLLLCTLLTAGWTWNKFYHSANNPASISAYLLIGAIGGFILALITTFKKEWAPTTAVAYALFEGLFIGGISAMLEVKFSGIVIQAASLTFGTLAAMLLAYQTGFIRATEKFKLGVFAATGGIAIVYVISMVLNLFHINVPFIYGNGLFSIGFSLFVVGIAALNFIIDFDFIEQGAAKGAPKYMEWYGAFAMMVTLIWLYVEFLNLLSKMRNR